MSSARESSEPVASTHVRVEISAELFDQFADDYEASLRTDGFFMVFEHSPYNPLARRAVDAGFVIRHRW